MKRPVLRGCLSFSLSAVLAIGAGTAVSAASGDSYAGVAISFAGGSRILNNYLHHNGTYGLAGGGANTLVEANEIAFNNTAGYATTSGGCWAAG